MQNRIFGIFETLRESSRFRVVQFEIVWNSHLSDSKEKTGPYSELAYIPWQYAPIVRHAAIPAVFS
jgi:hypothetical protein